MCGMFLVAAVGCGAAVDEDGPPPARSAAEEYGVPGSRERFEIRNNIVREKLDTALLPAMRRHGIDMWIVLDRENNPEPLHEELGGGFSGVRAAFIFYDRGGDAPEKIYFGSHEQPATSVIAQSYDVKRYYGYSKEGLTPLLREAVHSRAPKKIGVNTSPTLPEADGLTVGLRDFLVDAIGPQYARRLVSAELLVRDFRTSRTPRETELYTKLLEWTARWQSEALSDASVIPGRTTAADISWWLQDKALLLGMTGSGTPRVVRRGELLPLNAPDIPIEPGDIISIDGGLQYLGYATDIKRAAYVLRPGETEAPASIQEAWKETLRMADLYADSMRPGAVGYEVWEGLMSKTKALGYAVAYPDAGGGAASATRKEVGVYGHSVGNVAHDIGARIASNMPFAYGDRVAFPLVQGEWVSVEFHVSLPIPEWDGNTWYARFEDTGQVGPDGVRFMIPRQERLLLIGADHGRSGTN